MHCFKLKSVYFQKHCHIMMVKFIGRRFDLKEYYPFVNDPLPYSYDALEPFIDRETMHLHHDKHLQTYIDKLNALLEKEPELQKLSLEELLTKPTGLPRESAVPILNNAGGVYNHKMYFKGIGPEKISLEGLELAKAIKRDFGSREEFENKFKEMALSVFGSGYAWLVYENGKLGIITTPNQDVPLKCGFAPILLIDVWEHAYYLKYQNRRAEYIDNYMKIINWTVADERYRVRSFG